MRTIPARLDSKYRVVIPKPVREALLLEPQNTVLFLVDGDTVFLRSRPADFTGTLHGLHKELWSDPNGWLERERATWQWSPLDDCLSPLTS